MDGFPVTGHKAARGRAPLSELWFWAVVENGGEGGIRTPGTFARTTDFESAPFDRSGTSPGRGIVQFCSHETSDDAEPQFGQCLTHTAAILA